MSGIDWSGVDFRGPMLVEGALTPPCPGFAVGKPAMVVVRVQGAPNLEHDYIIVSSPNQTEKRRAVLVADDAMTHNHNHDAS